MFNKAQRKSVGRSWDQGERIAGAIGDKSADIARKTGKWVRENDSALLGIVAMTLGVGIFSYLLTRGRRFIIIV